MKQKLVHILLGSIGSILGVLIQYYTQVPADPIVVSFAGGATANALLSGAASKLFV